MTEESVVIIGAGWAGLAAAVKLTEQGKKVVLYESAKQAGGRARSVSFNDFNVDNGQHLLIGAYTQCLSLMETAGIDTKTVLKRLPLQLIVINKSSIENGNNELLLRGPALPAPLHLLYALMTAKGLKFKDKVAAVKFGLTLKKAHYHFNEDISVMALFIKTKQTQTLIKQLWEPLCLATMNTPIDVASANVFMTVFRDAFTNKTHDADSLVPRIDISNVFPNAAINYIENKGGKVFFKSRVDKIDVTDNKVVSIQVKQNNEIQTHKTSQVIIATAPQNLTKLLTEHAELKTTCDNIEKLKYEPIVTIYLHYSENVKLSQAMTGLTNTHSQWVFDRSTFCHQDGLISVVISSSGDHMTMDDDTLTEIVHSEISALFINKPTLINSFVIREKRATFASTVNINDLRPKNETAIKGLYLAGDYTDTGYPATLEGAVRSGVAASNLIIDKIL